MSLSQEQNHSHYQYGSTTSKTCQKTPHWHSTTTTTLPPNAGGTVAPPPPRIEAVGAGEARVKVDGKTEPAVVERVANQLVVSAGPLRATLGGVGDSGSTVPLDENGNVRLASGDAIKISLAGFEPGSEVEAWLFSTPVLLGRATVGADGKVSGTFTVPENSPEGAHRIAIVARTADGSPATLTVGVMVGEWDTEGTVTVWLIVTPIALAIMGALLLPATRRRRRRLN